MHRASPPLSAEKPDSGQSSVALNERLTLALRSSGQIAFDWHVDVDQLYFSSTITDGVKELLLDPSRVWRSSVLPLIFHRDDQGSLRASLHKALKGGGKQADEDIQVELRIQDAEGGWRWVNITGRIAERDGSGRALRMVGTFSDIDNRKREEHMIERLRNYYSMLGQVNQAIVRAQDRDVLFSEVCRIAVEQGNFESASISLIDSDSACMTPVATHELPQNDIHEIESLYDKIPHGADTPNHRTPDMHVTSGAAANFPIRAKGKLAGTLTLYASESDFFAPQLTGVLEEMAKDISFAIEHHERENRRKKSEALQIEQNRILNMVATGASLTSILMELAQFAETQCEGSLCSILQIASDGTMLSEPVAPSLPRTFLAQLGKIFVDLNRHFCDATAFHSMPVIVPDIARSPLWESCREIALSHGLKACASLPLFGRNREVVGIFALYFRKTIASPDIDSQALNICANLAGIAIESRASEERMRYLAHYDSLTSLPNRFLFAEYLDLALRNAQRSRKKFAVLFLDLDKFKEINDTFGHDAGDFVLCKMASRMRKCLRYSDKIARMGGDEFYVLLEDLNDGHDAADVAQKLLNAATRPVRVNGNDCYLSVSIGIGIYPDDGTDENELLKNADKAMYRVKKRGKNAFQFSSLHDVSRNHDVALMPTHQRHGKAQARIA